MTRWLADIFVGVSLGGGAYEVFALATRRTPPITTLARRWRRSPLLLLIAVPYAGLGWHLFVQR